MGRQWYVAYTAAALDLWLWRNDLFSLHVSIFIWIMGTIALSTSQNFCERSSRYHRGGPIVHFLLREGHSFLLPVLLLLLLRPRRPGLLPHLTKVKGPIFTLWTRNRPLHNSKVLHIWNDFPRNSREAACSTLPANARGGSLREMPRRKMRMPA